MTKIKHMLKGIFERFKPVFSRYPAAMILIALTSLTAALFIDQSGTFGKFMEDNGLFFFFLWGVGAYFIETVRPRGNSLKAAGIIGAGLVSAVLVYFGNHGTEVQQAAAGHAAAAYIFILVPLGIFRNYKDSGLPFNEYCIRTVHELSRLAVTCFIAGLGLAMVTAVFVVLILSGEHFMLIFRVEFLVLGCLTGSGVLYALTESGRELPRFFLTIVKSVLLNLLLIAFAIVYVYILKIVITRVVPSNEIFRILAGLFIIGLPIWTMAGTFEENSLQVRIGTKLPYIFIPFLFLQGYAIRERIAAYGLTPMRYLCLALMLFEVIYIAVYALRKKETGIMLPVFAILAWAALLMPYINMFSTSNRSQKAIFDRFFSTDFSDLAPEEQSSLAGAYYYLAGDPQGKLMLTDADPARIEAIEASGKIGSPDFDQNMFILFEFPFSDIDISEFKRMTAVSTYSVQEDESKESYDPENIVLYDTEGNSVLSADISDFVNASISSYAKDPAGRPDFPGVIELDENRQIRVKECTITIEPGQVITYLYLSGIMLEKE